ncbi:hypothetical protein FRC96_20435 [Lujinxingia vulgaris]|uniref:Uncharacterized protein n=1 Tax=Lujinxingia vulgaris TaxID=2600176 RepID=A0A5C6WTT5_9DELT|nr:hypothetical protein [Lujinxingia vulgaris]TXD31678.1 hypothetical protein FRC96_20435 [Lujinxingia vulgaris]
MARSLWQWTGAMMMAIAGAGCAASTSAPFHMYASPMLEDELAPPGARGLSDASSGEAGVLPAHVYVYRSKGGPAQPGQRRSLPAPATTPSRAPLDSVTRPQRPALASYRPSVTATGSSTTNAESASHPPAPRGPAAPEADGPLAAAYVHAVFALNGVTLNEDAASSVPELYRACRSEGKVYHSSRPAIGDMVFFHNTYDANDDGRNNDWYTAVGIVEELQSGGTASVLAYLGDGVRRLYLNLEHVDREELDGGQHANSVLREQRESDPPFTQYLAGQLFAGFCNALGDRDELMVVDNWQPGMDLSAQ